MLESIAKTKQCPIVRVGNYCIGSWCMIFNVTVEGTNDLGTVKGRETEGYCGLARR